MMQLQELIAGCQKNAERVMQYRIGGTGADGSCDCIGLVMGGMKLAGGSWPGEHSTNWAARSGMRSLKPIYGSGELQAVELVYKSREPGESGYSLPSRFQGGDPLDYYHVGLVVSASPLKILHCTSPGPIVTDTRIWKWAWHGFLKSVEVEPVENETDYQTAINPGKRRLRVTASSGKTVRMRDGINGKVMCTLPLGMTVEAEPTDDPEWMKITAEGYMMSKFLKE